MCPLPSAVANYRASLAAQSKYCSTIKASLCAKHPWQLCRVKHGLRDIITTWDWEYIHTYIHTYIRTCIHIHIYITLQYPDYLGISISGVK